MYSHTHTNSYMTLIGVHEMHVVDLRSLLAYFIMTHPLPVAGKLPIKTLVAKQLPINTHTVNT